jgi:rare lipoprotein A (peptidoglycan hydrolase)
MPESHETYRGTATWYCSRSSACPRGYGPRDLVAAIDRKDTPFRKGDRVIVRHGSNAITVRIVDVCACAGRRLIDLTSGAFARLAPPSAGVISITLQRAGSRGPTPTLPPTDR